MYEEIGIKCVIGQEILFRFTWISSSVTGWIASPSTHKIFKTFSNSSVVFQ